MPPEQSIRKFILENYLFTEDEQALENSASLIEMGVIDSTGVMELVAFLEEQFGIRMLEDELVPENLDSVDRIVAFVIRKQGVTAGNAAASGA